jgi:hypothetical protein
MLTRAADLYGRCISFLGRCVPPEASGSSVFGDIPMLADTANHHMVCTGLVYPTYYRALFPELRKKLTTAMEHARDSGLGVWRRTEPPPVR